MKTIQRSLPALAVLASLGLVLGGCGDANSDDHHLDDAGDHPHADGAMHLDHEDGDHADGTHMGVEDHEHDETVIDPAT